MTAPIPLPSGRVAPSRQAGAKHRSVALAAALALACVISAAVSWLSPARRAGSGLEGVTSSPALAPPGPGGVPPVTVQTPSAIDDSPGNAGAGIETVAAARSAPAPAPHRALPPAPEVALDADAVEPTMLAPEQPSPAARRRSGPSTLRPGKHGVRGARKHASRKGASGRRLRASKRRSAALPPPARLEPDPFAERE